MRVFSFARSRNVQLSFQWLTAFPKVDRLPKEGHTLVVLVVQLEAKDGYFPSDGERPE